MPNQPEPWYKDIIEATLRELEDSKRLSSEHLALSRELVPKFIKVAENLLTESTEEGARRKGQGTGKATAILELFSIGLLKAFYLAEEAAISEDAYNSALHSIALDIFQEAQDLVEKGDDPNQSATALPTEQQKALIQQKTARSLLPYLVDHPKYSLYKEDKIQNKEESVAGKEKAFKKLQPYKLYCFYRIVSNPISSVFYLIEQFRQKGVAAELDNNSDKELVLHHPAWFAVAWGGPLFIWAIYHIQPHQLLPYAALLPVAVITALWLRPFVRQGLFHCTSESLLLVVSLNTVLLVSNWFATWLLLLAQMVLLAGFVFGFLLKKLINKQEEALAQIKADQAELINPDRFYVKLGVDHMALIIGQNLLVVADQDLDGMLCPKLANLRDKMTEKWGYIIPKIRIMDSIHIAPNEYQIWVRGNLVAKGCIYPGRYMLTESDFGQKSLSQPETIIEDLEPVYGAEKAYWLASSEIPESLKSQAKEAVDVLIDHLQEVSVRQVDLILTPLEVMKLMELIKHYHAKLVQDLVPEKLEVVDLRRMFVNLLREKVSIRDIVLIFERLLEYMVICQGSSIRVSPDTISEHLRRVLRRQICLQHANKQLHLSVIELSDDWNKTLSQHVTRDEFGVHLKLEVKTKRDFIESVKAAFHRIPQSKDLTPVILCNSSIRLALFRLLESHIPTLVVMSDEEIVPDVMIVVLDTV